MEKERKNRDTLNEIGYENLIIFENPDYDSAIIGVSHDDRVVYSYNRMVKHLMDTDGMTYEDAMEFIDYNTIRAIPYFGSNAPIVVRDEELFQEVDFDEMFGGNGEKEEN